MGRDNIIPFVVLLIHILLHELMNVIVDSDQIEGGYKDEFFSTNPDSTFTIMYEEYKFREQYFLKGMKLKNYMMENNILLGKYIGKLNKILDVLKKLITNNPEKIRDLWQFRSIGKILIFKLNDLSFISDTYCCLYTSFGPTFHP